MNGGIELQHAVEDKFFSLLLPRQGQEEASMGQLSPLPPSYPLIPIPS